MARGFVQGFVEQGGHTVVTDGRTSTTKVQRSFPSSTVTVFNAGTAVLATIASDQGGTPKANPFVADADGSWDFWAASASYDVQFSGQGIDTPFTLFSIFVPDPAITAPLQDPGSNGVLVRTALQTTVARTITGTNNEITVANGSGVAGDPTISLPTSLTFTGKTITGGTYAAVSSLGIRSSGAAFDIQLLVTEVLTANRTLTISVNNTNSSVTFPANGTLATLAGVETFTNKTLTSPRIGTALLDTNGNEVIETPATALAVNHIRVTNSATGSAVQTTAVGDDANISWRVAAKGTGRVIIPGYPFTLEVNITQVAASGGGLVNLHSYTVPANTLASNGDYIETWHSGSFAADSDSKGLSMNVGGLNNINTGAIDIGNSEGWSIHTRIVRVTSTSIRVLATITAGIVIVTEANSASGGGVGGIMYSESDDIAVADLAVNTFNIIVQSNSTNAGDVTQDLSIIQVVQRA